MKSSVLFFSRPPSEVGHTMDVLSPFIVYSLFRIKCSRTSMTDENKKKIQYNTITYAHTDTQSYKHARTPRHRYNHGENLILITNRETSS